MLNIIFKFNIRWLRVFQGGLHSYVGYKKTIAGSGLLLIDMESDFCMLSPGVVGHLQASDYGQN